MTEPAATERKKSWIDRHKILSVLLLFAVLAVIFNQSSSGKDTPAASPDPTPTVSTPNNGSKIGAQVVCRQFVENRLKAPSTAEFSGEAAWHVSGEFWRVAGDVDAQNGFGAMIRNSYGCKVRHTTGNHWRLVTLTGLSS